MRKIGATEFVHWALTLLLALGLGSVTLLNHWSSEKTLAAASKIVVDRPLSEDIHLYVTEWTGGNATTSFVFRYYLTSKVLDPDTVKVLAQRTPVLTADNRDSVIYVADRRVMLSVRGRVHRFSNVIYLTDADGRWIPKPLEIVARIETEAPESMR